MTVRLFTMTCGWLDMPYALMARGADGVITVPVPAFLIDHPKGSVLFDSGLSVGMQGTKEQRRRDIGDIADSIGSRFTPGEDVSARLRGAGRDPDSINFIINSHLHFDHAGGNTLVPNATMIVQSREWVHVHSADGRPRPGFNPAHYELGNEVVLIDGRHDLFGDSTVICVPTYGHTPGHQSLLVRLADGDVLITADACYFRETLSGRALPEVLDDPQQMTASLDAIDGYERGGTALIFGHDSLSWSKLNSGPLQEVTAGAVRESHVDG